jgi:G3E family GTPase
MMSPPPTTTTTTDDWEAHRVNLFRHAENVRIFDKNNAKANRQLPVTLVSGSLGSGKTTLLRHILTNQSNLRIAAAVNDFAELNIDQNLLIPHNNSNAKSGAAASRRIIALSNGCVCCHLLDDLQTAVWNLLEGGGNGGDSNNNSSDDWELDDINYLVIETSGVSDPTRIIRMLDAKFGKCFRARLDSVVVVVDTDQLLSSLLPVQVQQQESSADNNTTTTTTRNTRMSPTTVTQLQCADVILLNKMDLLLANNPKDIALVEDYVQTINDSATIYRTSHCKIPLSTILDVQIPKMVEATTTPITHEASNIPIYISATGGALRSSASRAVSSSSSSSPTSNTFTSQPHSLGEAHDEDHDYVSLSKTFSERPLSLHKLQQFITSPVVQRLARMKGVVWIQGLEAYRCILHLSGRGRLGFHIDGPWIGPPTSEMVFIGHHRRSSSADWNWIRKELDNFCIVDDDNDGNQHSNNDDHQMGLDLLRNTPEFVIVDNPLQQSSSSSSSGRSMIYFRLTGSNIYGYTEDEIRRDLRVDTNALNLDLVNAINVGLDHQPKAFLPYTLMPSDDDGRTTVVLCYTGMGQPANNTQVLLREAKAVLATHFRNVQVCKCGI